MYQQMLIVQIAFGKLKRHQGSPLCLLFLLVFSASYSQESENLIPTSASTVFSINNINLLNKIKPPAVEVKPNMIIAPKLYKASG